MSALRLSPAFAAWAQLAADLVNTRPRETDPPEKLRSEADLQALLARCPEPPPALGEDDLDGMRALRPVLVAAFEAGSFEAFAAALNPLLGGDWRLAPAGSEWALAPAGGGSVPEWFGARAARGLAELALTYGLERLHMCSADDCLRAVVDVSRNGTRRYCSRTCANRMNARRHRAAAR